MAFYFNQFSGDSIENQWSKYCQNMSYVNTVGHIISKNKQELQETIKSASENQIKAFNKVCGSIDEGFANVSQNLQTVNFNISNLRGEINEMASMLDWKLSLLIEEQRVTNQLLGHISQLLRIPDSQKQRVYLIEKGLKYLKSAIPDGFDSEYYTDAMESFKEAEIIERKDYITLNRIGQIYLYSKTYLDFQLAKEYFLKSAREAIVEANADGTTVSNNFIPIGQISIIYTNQPFKAAAAESYLYASRASYLEQNILEAIDLAGKAYNLIPEFLEAGFEKAKYLAANNQEKEAANVLETVINKDRYFSIKTLVDKDLNSKQAILELLDKLYQNSLADAKIKLNDCEIILQSGSKAIEILKEIKNDISRNNYLSSLKALDYLNGTHELPYITHYTGKDYNFFQDQTISRNIAAPKLKLVEFIQKENNSNLEFGIIRSSIKASIFNSRTLMGLGIGAFSGFVIGFFKGCSLSKFSMDSGTWMVTLIICALIGTAIGAIIGFATEPKIIDNTY